MTDKPTTKVTMFAAAEGGNEYTKLLAENAKLRAENARLRWHRALLRPFAARVLKEFWQEVQRQSEISLVFRLTLVIEQTPLVESAVAAIIETDPERDAEELKPVTTEVAALCAAEAFLGAQEECQRLRTRLAKAEHEAASLAERLRAAEEKAKSWDCFVASLATCRAGGRGPQAKFIDTMEKDAPR